MSTKLKNDGHSLCLVTGCPRPPRSRGLCDTHYPSVALKVASCKYNWEQLEKAGVCFGTRRKKGASMPIGEFIKGKGL